MNYGNFITIQFNPISTLNSGKTFKSFYPSCYNKNKKGKPELWVVNSMSETIKQGYWWDI